MRWSLGVGFGAAVSCAADRDRALKQITATSAIKPIFAADRIACLTMRLFNPARLREKCATQTNATPQGTVMGLVNQWRTTQWIADIYFGGVE